MLHDAHPRLGLAAAVALAAALAFGGLAAIPTAVAQPQPPPPPSLPSPPAGPQPPGQPPAPPQPPSPPAPSASGSSAIMLSLEQPAADANVTDKQLLVKGWAVDQSAPDGTGIDAVQVYIDGSMQTGSLLGDANYGVPRQDVAAALGQGDRYLFSGFEFNWTEVLRAAPGVHTITVAAHSPTNGWAERTVPVSIVGKLELNAWAYPAAGYYPPPVNPGPGPYPPPPPPGPITRTHGVIPVTPPGTPGFAGGVGAPLIPVTFVAQVTRNGAPIAGAEVTINGTIPMPPTDPSGSTQLTVTLPYNQSVQGVAAHLTATFEGQVADTDAYVRY